MFHYLFICMLDEVVFPQELIALLAHETASTNYSFDYQ